MYCDKLTAVEEPMKKVSIAFLMLTLVLGFVISVCATSPPQIRPTDASTFVGEWEGSWRSSTGASGGVTYSIQPPDSDGFLPFSLKHHRDTHPYNGKFKFENGQLLLVSVDPPCFSKLTLSLHGDGNLATVEWFNSCSNAQGQTSLTRKK